MNGPSHEYTEYARALRWLRDIGEHLSECRYSTTTSTTVIDSARRLEDDAKAWVAQAMLDLNESILKREPSGT